MKHWMAARRQGVQANGLIFSSSACHFWLSHPNLAPDQSSGQRGALVPWLPWAAGIPDENPQPGCEAPLSPPSCALFCQLWGQVSISPAFNPCQASQPQSLPSFPQRILSLRANLQWFGLSTKQSRRGNAGFSLLASNLGHLLRMQKTWVHFCLCCATWICRFGLPLAVWGPSSPSTQAVPICLT